MAGVSRAALVAPTRAIRKLDTSGSLRGPEHRVNRIEDIKPRKNDEPEEGETEEDGRREEAPVGLPTLCHLRPPMPARSRRSQSPLPGCYPRPCQQRRRPGWNTLPWGHALVTRAPTTEENRQVSAIDLAIAVEVDASSISGTDAPPAKQHRQVCAIDLPVSINVRGTLHRHLEQATARSLWSTVIPGRALVVVAEEEKLFTGISSAESRP